MTFSKVIHLGRMGSGSLQLKTVGSPPVRGAFIAVLPYKIVKTFYTS